MAGLTAEQVQRYRDDGYLLVEGVFDPSVADELKAELLRIFQSGAVTIKTESLSPEILHFSLGSQRESAVRSVIEELENMIQEFRIMVRLDVEYGDILIDKEDWDVELKCYDRSS